MIVGFTGTREGMTPSQKQEVRSLLLVSLQKEHVRCRDCGWTTTKFNGWAFCDRCFGPDAGWPLHNLELVAAEGHHGDCVGADEEFHGICMELDVPVVIHPPKNPRYRAFCEGAIRVEEPQHYLVRNQAIVRASALLIGAPKERSEPPPARGQGTWSTIRFARNVGVEYLIVFP